jgi:lipoate synthase
MMLGVSETKEEVATRCRSSKKTMSISLPRTVHTACAETDEGQRYRTRRVQEFKPKDKLGFRHIESGPLVRSSITPGAM